MSKESKRSLSDWDILSLIDELNQHTDLTTKLSNQSKICNIFKQNG